MSKQNRKGIQKAITLYPQQNDFLKFAVENKGAASESEIIRWALDDYKKSHYPDYIWKLTPGEEEKKTLAAKKRAFDQLSPEDYAKSIGAVVVSGKESDARFAIIHGFQNGTNFRPLEDLKDFFTKKDPEWLQIHLSRNKNQSVESLIKKDLESPGGRSNYVNFDMSAFE